MSIGYRNRKKEIKRMRKEFQSENIDVLKYYAAEFNDRWCGLAAKLALGDRGIRI